MKFSAREDIEVPIDAAFEMVSDFDMLERSIMGRGAEVRRTDTLPAPGVGMAWDAEMEFQGKRRKLTVELTRYDPPNGLAAEVKSEGLLGLFDVELLALSPSRTRVAVQFDVTAKTLTARLLLQSLKLAKSRLEARFEERVDGYVKDMEARYRDRA